MTGAGLCPVSALLLIFVLKTIWHYNIQQSFCLLNNLSHYYSIQCHKMRCCVIYKFIPVAYVLLSVSL